MNAAGAADITTDGPDGDRQGHVEEGRQRRSSRSPSRARASGPAARGERRRRPDGRAGRRRSSSTAAASTGNIDSYEWTGPTASPSPAPTARRRPFTAPSTRGRLHVHPQGDRARRPVRHGHDRRRTRSIVHVNEITHGGREDRVRRQRRRTRPTRRSRSRRTMSLTLDGGQSRRRRGVQPGARSRGRPVDLGATNQAEADVHVPEDRPQADQAAARRSATRASRRHCTRRRRVHHRDDHAAPGAGHARDHDGALRGQRLALACRRDRELDQPTTGSRSTAAWRSNPALPHRHRRRPGGRHLVGRRA